MAMMLSGALWAQSGTNSPYSQYGLGVLADQSQSFSRGMNGVGLGFRRGNVVNTLNPASYSSVDSLTMLFDVAVSGQITHFKENGTSVNANNANIEYAVGSFRLLRGLGFSFGILPFSNVGYHYSVKTPINTTYGSETETYSGSGGLHQVFAGAGLSITKQLSVGANMSFLWGSTTNTMTSTVNSSVNTMSRQYSATIQSYKLDLGLQWLQPLANGDRLALGAVTSIGHKMSGNPELVIANSSVADTLTAKDAVSLPMSYGVGVAWYKGQQLVVDADVHVTNWGSIDAPVYYSEKTGKTLTSAWSYKNSYKVGVGADYVPNYIGRKYFQRIHYKVGAGYATPYYKTGTDNGPSEFSLSAGLGLPLQNAYNNRSVLNISAQWVHASAKDRITENMFRVTVGLTFNERWFTKWKVE